MTAHTTLGLILIISHYSLLSHIPLSLRQYIMAISESQDYRECQKFGLGTEVRRGLLVFVTFIVLGLLALIVVRRAFLM